MHRFFIDEVVNEKQIIIHNMDDVKHIKKALRVVTGEKLEICDGTGSEYVVEVIALDDVVTCKVLHQVTVQRESPVEIHLIQGLAKGSKMDTIVQKAVELGASRIIPLQSKRSIVKLDSKGINKKIERWQKISDEASKQSKRTKIPIIDSVIDISTLEQLVTTYDIVLIAYELESSRALKECLDVAHKKIGIVIGPEGGFEKEEVDTLVSLGAISISLGPRILRTETAGMMLLSILQYELGDVSS